MIEAQMTDTSDKWNTSLAPNGKRDKRCQRALQTPKTNSQFCGKRITSIASGRRGNNVTILITREGRQPSL